MVLDGCSEAKFSEAGTRLFSQLFRTIEDYDKVEKFEDNVKITFDRIMSQLSKWYKTQEEIEDFIMENLLFTIVACFKKEDSYIVKIFGDRLYSYRKHIWKY